MISIASIRLLIAIALMTSVTGRQITMIDKKPAILQLSQVETEHLITVIPGILKPCGKACPRGQFIWRTHLDPEDDCSCRYEMNHCDDENYEFDTRTGECVCMQRLCPDNHYWEYSSCRCQCVHHQDCQGIEIDGVIHESIWDHRSCQCVCLPQVCDEGFTWNLADCACTCLI